MEYNTHPFSTVAKMIHDAVECIHPSQDSKYARMLMDIAVKKNLFQTGGSDFHGSIENGIDLGLGGDGMMIPESFLHNLHSNFNHIDT